MITDVEPFSTVDDNNRLPLEERLSNSLRVMREKREYNKAQEKQDYTTADKLGASLREFGIGFRGMHERALSLQSSYPSTKGLPRDDRFVFSDSFSQLIKDNKISTDDERALMEQGVGNEQEFYLARAKQERYNQDQEIIKDMSPLALITTGIGVSVFDPSSWVLGGVVGKAFQGLYTGAKVGKYTLLGLRGAEGATTAGLINYATEKTNQEAAGVSDDEKLLQLTSYGAAFGLALPVLPTAITQISQGAYRSRGAQIAREYMQTNPVTSSLRKYLSLGAGEQTKWQSTNPLVQEYSWAIAPSTGIRRAPDGTPVVQRTTAMELRAKYSEGNLKQAFEGIQENAKQYGSGAKAWAEASKADGGELRYIVGDAEQSYGATLGQLTSAEKIAYYKRVMNIDELPEEASRRVEINKIQERLDELMKIRASVEGTNTPKSMKAGLSKKIKTAQKKIEELKTKPLAEPDDLFNVLRADLHKQAVATGKFKLPPHLEYMGKFFKSFSDTATKLNVSGIAGREGYGYFPVRYNREFAISNPVGYKQQMEQAIRTDSYNMALIQRGELTDEDILAQVERFYQKAVDDDVRYKYLEKGVKSGSGTSSKARKVHINRRDFPDLFVDDATEILGAYAREQGGRNAFIEVFGIDPYAKGSTPRGTIDSMLKEVADKGRELGIPPKKVNKDVENLKAMLEGVLDVRRIQIDPNTFTNTAVRTLKGLASTAFSAGFVKYNLVEWLSGAVHTDFSKTVRNYLPAMDAVIKDMRGLPTNSPEFEAMRHTILASHSLMGQMFSRLDANELTGRLSIIENGIHGINNGIRKFTGFNITTDINEVAIAGAGMKKLFSLNPNNLTVRDVEWLSRYGFSTDDLKAIINNKDIKRDKKGGIADYNLDGWKNQELAGKFSVFMERVARDTIPVPNASTLHRFQSDVNDPIKSLFFQYTQVPTVLWDKVFLTVADRPTADAMMGLGMATLGMYTIFKMDDELKVRLGLKEEPTDDKEIFTRAFLSTGFVGVGGMGATAALTALGMEVPGVTYRGDTDLLSQTAGAGGSMLKRASDMLKAIGSGDVEKGATIINNSNPLNAIPLLGNFFKAGGKMLIEGEPLSFTTSSKNNISSTRVIQTPIIGGTQNVPIEQQQKEQLKEGVVIKQDTPNREISIREVQGIPVEQPQQQKPLEVVVSPSKKDNTLAGFLDKAELKALKPNDVQETIWRVIKETPTGQIENTLSQTPIEKPKESFFLDVKENSLSRFVEKLKSPYERMTPEQRTLGEMSEEEFIKYLNKEIDGYVRENKMTVRRVKGFNF